MSFGVFGFYLITGFIFCGRRLCFSVMDLVLLFFVLKSYWLVFFSWGPLNYCGHFVFVCVCYLFILVLLSAIRFLWLLFVCGCWVYIVC